MAKGKCRTKTQFIKTPSGDEMVILPRADFENLVTAAQDAFDDLDDAAEAKAILARNEVGSEGVLPHEVVMRMRTENRVRVLREYREMTQKELAERAGVNSVDISQIETDLTVGGRHGLKRIAIALGVPLGVILMK